MQALTLGVHSWSYNMQLDFLCGGHDVVHFQARVTLACVHDWSLEATDGFQMVFAKRSGIAMVIIAGGIG